VIYPKYKDALNLAMQAIQKANIKDEDQDIVDTQNGYKDFYNKRALPYLIGTTDYENDKCCGVYVDDLDSVEEEKIEYTKGIQETTEGDIQESSSSTHEDEKPQTTEENQEQPQTEDNEVKTEVPFQTSTTNIFEEEEKKENMFESNESSDKNEPEPEIKKSKSKKSEIKKTRKHKSKKKKTSKSEDSLDRAKRDFREEVEKTVEDIAPKKEKDPNLKLFDDPSSEEKKIEKIEKKDDKKLFLDSDSGNDIIKLSDDEEKINKDVEKEEKEENEESKKLFKLDDDSLDDFLTKQGPSDKKKK